MPLVYSAELLLRLLAQDFRSYTAWRADQKWPCSVPHRGINQQEPFRAPSKERLARVPSLASVWARLSQPPSSLLRLLTLAAHVCGPTTAVSPAFMSFILLLQRAGAVSRHRADHMQPRKHYFREEPRASGPGAGPQSRTDSRAFSRGFFPLASEPGGA